MVQIHCVGAFGAGNTGQLRWGEMDGGIIDLV